MTGFSPLGSSGSEQILGWMGGDPTNLTTEYFKMMSLLKLQKSMR